MLEFLERTGLESHCACLWGACNGARGLRVSAALLCLMAFNCQWMVLFMCWGLSLKVLLLNLCGCKSKQ